MVKYREVFLCIFLCTHFYLWYFLSDGQTSTDETVVSSSLPKVGTCSFRLVSNRSTRGRSAPAGAPSTWNWSSCQVVLDEHHLGTFYNLEENFSKCLSGGTFAFQLLVWPWWPRGLKTLQRKKVWRGLNPFEKTEIEEGEATCSSRQPLGSRESKPVFWIEMPCHCHFTVLPPRYFWSWPCALLHVQTLWMALDRFYNFPYDWLISRTHSLRGEKAGLQGISCMASECLLTLAGKGNSIATCLLLFILHVQVP